MVTRAEAKEWFPFIQALADGTPIERFNRRNGKWEDVDQIDFGMLEDYRVKPEQKYRPYANAKEFRAAQKEHGLYCVLTNLTEYTIDLPTQISDKIFYMSDVDFTYEDALKSLTWEDGSPCGVLTDNTN